MAISIVKIDDLPLGCRILRFGCYGQDVIELQKLLNRDGFYFGESDGWYGMLTGEAVTSLQRTFHLRVDGIVGPEVLHVLLKKGSKRGRIIYRVKKNEGLDLISRQFGVKESAWRRIPGQGDPHKKICPGLLMLLHEKILLSWELSSPQAIPSPMTGIILDDYQMSIDDESVFVTDLQDGGSFSGPSLYHVIGATRETWDRVLSSPKLWVELAYQLEKLKNFKFGFDLREAPIEKLTYLEKFLQMICRRLKLSELEFQVLPLLPAKRKLENHLYWINLSGISFYTKYILLEPRYNMESPILFQESAAAIFKNTAKVLKTGLAEKVLLICQIAGWDWNMDLNHVEQVSYKVAKSLRGQYTPNIQYLSDSKLCSIYYVKHHEHHCLIYRDEAGWGEFLNQVLALNLAGVVMINFKDLGKAGPKIIAGSFNVQSWN